MMIRKRLLFSIVAGILLCIGCSEGEKTMFDYTIERASGQHLSLTMDNIAGRWAVNKMYNDYSDLTAVNPTLKTGFLELRTDSTFSYCQNYKMDPVVYAGRIDCDSLAMGILNLVDIPDPENEGFNRPNIRLIISAVTANQIEIEWEHFDPEVGTSGGGTGLLFEYEFKLQPEPETSDDPEAPIPLVSRGQLKPTIYNESIEVSEFEAMYPYRVDRTTGENQTNTKMLWQYARTSTELGGDGITVTPVTFEVDSNYVILGGFGSNLNDATIRTSNAHFYVSCEDMVVIDSLSFTGLRRRRDLPHGSRIRFFWSPTEISALVTATEYHELKITDQTYTDIEKATMPTLTPVKGKGFWLAISANIGYGGNGAANRTWGGTNTSTLLYLYNVGVYGRIYEGERFHYYYLMNKMQ